LDLLFSNNEVSVCQKDAVDKEFDLNSFLSINDERWRLVAQGMCDVCSPDTNHTCISHITTDIEETDSLASKGIDISKVLSLLSESEKLTGVRIDPSTGVMKETLIDFSSCVEL
jgi:hypothetical protein